MPGKLLGDLRPTHQDLVRRPHSHASRYLYAYFVLPSYPRLARGQTRDFEQQNNLTNLASEYLVCAVIDLQAEGVDSGLSVRSMVTGITE